MKAVVFQAPGEVTVTEAPRPNPGPHEVRVEVGATGLCAGDLYIFFGRNPYAAYPIIGGHEIAGVVAAVGAEVTAVRPGERVVVEPFIGCGKCYPCRVGKPNCCAHLRILGVHQPGGFAESLVAPVDRLHRVPAGLPLAHACLAEPLAIGVQACRRGQVKAGERVLVLGCGPIGLAIIEVALALGARPVAADLDARRLALAGEVGATTVPAGDALLEQALALTGGEGMPVVVEATGSAAVMEQTIDLVAAGGRIVIVGLVKRGVGVTLPGLDITRKEVTLVGSRASTGCFPEALALLAAGRSRLPALATEISLWEAPAIFNRLRADPVALHKGVFTVPGGPR